MTEHSMPPPVPGKKDETRMLFRTEDTQETIAKKIKREHPDWPPIKLAFHFSSHGSIEDMAGMKDAIKNADIYFYEHDDEEMTSVLQKLSNADPDKFEGKPFNKVIKRVVNNRWARNYTNVLAGTNWDAIMQNVYGSNKIIGGIDVTDTDPITHDDVYNSYSEPYPQTNFEGTLENIKTKATKIASVNHGREDIMVSRFSEKLNRIFEEHPELKDKPDITIVATMGSYHTPLFYKFASQGLDTSRSFSTNPYIYSYLEQAIRDIAFGKEPSKELLAKAYISNIIYYELNKAMTEPILNTDESTRYIRQLATKFTMEDVRSIHEYCYGDGTQRGRVASPRLMEMLEEKKVASLPQTNGELHDALSDPAAKLYEQRNKRAEEEKTA